MPKRLLLFPLLLSVTCPTAWAQLPVGGEFQVNSYTTTRQNNPAVASDVNGNFVVVWESYFQDGSGYGIFGQHFNASGVPQGSEFRVSSYTTGYQSDPAVASDASGNFVVVWGSNGQDGSEWGIFGQRFNSAGLPRGSEFQVNSYTTGSQRVAAVASDIDGNFVAVWESDRPGDWAVFGQRFNADGVPQGGEFQVNTHTTGYEHRPAVASDPNGNFVVAWQSWDQDGSSLGIFGQRFDAAGVPQVGEFQVNTYTTDSQNVPALACDASGNFVVVWTSFGQDGSYSGVFGQRFSASGVLQGGEFQVNTYTTGHQGFPAVASDVNGNFVVVWTSDIQDGSDGPGVFGQRFNASGVPQGSEFRVNSYTTGFQSGATVAADANGNFVVAWQSLFQDGSDYGVFGQRYGDLIFRDGFQ